MSPRLRPIGYISRHIWWHRPARSALAHAPTKALALAAGVLLLATLAQGHASADVGQRLPRLARLRAQVARESAPLAYVTLRNIWTEWDRGEPAEVEETLHAIGQDAAERAPVRAYAQLLEAYARRRRGDLDGARARIARLGFVDRWMMVGPFDNEGKVGLDATYDPETQQVGPLDLTHSFDGKAHHPVKWRMAPAVSPYAWVDFTVFMRPTENTCAYATTFVRDARTTEKQPPRTISLWAGSAGAFRAWWDNTEVLRDAKYRNLDADRFAAQVTLRTGWNRLVVKVCGVEGAGGPMISMRLAGEDGAPDDHLEVDADPSHSTVQGGAVLPLGRGAPAVPYGPSRVEGSIQGFDRVVASGDPAMMEAYARFMTLTEGDDSSEHRARDIAAQAAQKSPTIPRLLLAGDLAENRNQRAVWIEQAEAIVHRGGASEEDTLSVLLARAAHARGGSNWRDAVPFYEQALQLDSDNVIASLARVELYQEAGLRATALAFLEEALARRPKSVALLRALVAAFRQDSRTTEAEDAAERYAQLRFDDPTFARAHIELAVARRDKVTATHWIERLMATNPDSTGALEAAAAAYTSLGDRPKSIALLRRGLDLAPEDTDTMHELADAYGLAGQRDDQLKQLKHLLELKPQANDVRDYVARSEPAKPKADEVYAHPSSEFLSLRGAPSGGLETRTFVKLQVTTVFPNGLASRFHQVVYQPLTDAAAARALEYEFAYEADTETVQVRGARVYRANGQVEDAVESGEGNAADDPSSSVYTSARVFYVRFPRLNPGDVVELQYRVEDIAPRNVFADYFGEVVYMQSAEPIARSEYVLITPKARAFYFNRQPHVPGLVQSKQEQGDTLIYKFLATNVPQIDSESAQPPYPEILGHVNVSTFRTWEEMATWYWGLVKDQFIPDDEVRRRVEELAHGLTDDRAKAKAVYDYVVQKTRYVALEFGIMGFKPYRCSQIFARGFGDCKDKATLIVTMLKQLGIPATIVIVRTGMKGLVEDYPASLAPFDHAIAYVPSLDLYLDGTAEYTGSTELPAMDRGAVALQINEGNAKLVHLPDPPPSDSVSSANVDAVVGADGGAQVEWQVAVNGVDASRWRVSFHADATRKERVQNYLGNLLPGFQVTQLDAGNFEDVEKAVSMDVHGKTPQFARLENGTMSIPLGPAPYFVKEFAPISTRQLDLRFGAQTTSREEWTVHLPPGARVKSSPSPSQGSTPFGSFNVEVEATTGMVRVKTTITKTRSRIAAADYPAFQSFCETVDKALGQRVIVGMP